MQINLTKDQITDLAEKRDSDISDEDEEKEAALVLCMKAAANRGYMTRGDLTQAGDWKWPSGRTGQLCGENTEAEVEEITRVSFAAGSERLRIGSLLALRGVGWPMASVILHFAFPDRYPILDVRAMNTVGGSTYYTFKKWVEYTELCQTAAKREGVTMRQLDKALWAYDKIRNASGSKGCAS